jgi:hypothetical protein
MVTSYRYIPQYPKDPVRELENNLATYRELVETLTEHDGLEIANSLTCRDAIAWALKQIGDQVEEEILAEIERLDTLLQAGASYIVHQALAYQGLVRQGYRPASAWWWYLEEWATGEAEPEAGRRLAVTDSLLIKGPVVVLPVEEYQRLLVQAGQKSLQP